MRSIRAARENDRQCGVDEASIEVVVCDDEPDLRLLLKVVLSRDPEIVIVGEAANGAEAVDIARSLQPDVLLLDIAMPMMDGLEALPLIREASPETRVVVFTGFERAVVPQTDQAFGFLEKGAPARTIVQMVRNAALERVS
jgi:DNA-binding NarL/FixJ family response regulator